MQKKKKTKVAIAIIAVSIILICGIIYINRNGAKEKVDDWKYGEEVGYDGAIDTSGSKVSGITNTQSIIQPGALTAESTMSTGTSTNIGFSTGGAKDVNNFRENIENGYFPISTDITYNGLFYDYTFDTGRKEKSTELFSPSYSTAISKDPISNNEEYYMTVGLNSNISESDFQRKKLNLVVVLDISGSMSSSFSSYYYDEKVEEKDKNKTKMQIANESVNILIDQLNDDDRFGMVLFDNTSYLAKELNLISRTDVEAIKEHVLEITPQGGTNFESGYTKASTLFDEYLNINKDEYENRMIVITDAMPNYGTTSKAGLMSYVEKNAENGIYTSFIGVGVDFNSELIEQISDVKGANYYSVHNSSEFKERMGEQFEYMVTPLVFDLQLKLNSDDFEIATVYGSDTVNKENGSIMNVNTLFPSVTTDTGEVKGGVILLKLNKKNDKTSGEISLNVSYKDRSGKEYSNSKIVKMENREEYYDNTGIRKAILLTRYANVLKNWILYERCEEDIFLITTNRGIIDCDYTKQDVYKMLGENERTSVKLSVSNEYKSVFEKMKQYIQQENKFINDESLNQEIELLDMLIEI